MKRLFLALTLCVLPLTASNQNPPAFAVKQLLPADFKSAIWSPSVHILQQSGALVGVPHGGPAPTYVRFRDRNGMDLRLSVTGAVRLSPTTWRITTPIGLTPSQRGAVGVSVGGYGVESAMAGGWMR